MQFGHVVVLQDDDGLCLVVVQCRGSEGVGYGLLGYVILHGRHIHGHRRLARWQYHRRGEGEALVVLALQCNLLGLCGDAAHGDGELEGLTLSEVGLGGCELQVGVFIVLDDECGLGRIVCAASGRDGDQGVCIKVGVVGDRHVCHGPRLPGSDSYGCRYADTAVLGGVERKSLVAAPVTAAAHPDGDAARAALHDACRREFDEETTLNSLRLAGRDGVVALGRSAFARVAVGHDAHLQTCLALDAEQLRQHYLDLPRHRLTGGEDVIIVCRGDELLHRTATVDEHKLFAPTAASGYAADVLDLPRHHQRPARSK